MTTTLQEYLNERYPTAEAKKEVKFIEKEKSKVLRKIKGRRIRFKRIYLLRAIIINGHDLKSFLTSLDVSN
jgi:hypothetical protein